MEAMQESIKQLYTSLTGKSWDLIEKIPQSGGDRIYF